MQEHFAHILKELNQEQLKNTPKRAAQALEFLTKGYHEDIATIAKGATFPSENDQMVILKDIEFYSLCEHHILPFFGKCHIGYLPNGKLIGISRIAKIIDHYAHRLQIQENLTQQIATTLLDITGAKGVGVVMEGQHLCMMMRGVQKQHSTLKTSCMLGNFRKRSETRNEFLSLL